MIEDLNRNRAQRNTHTVRVIRKELGRKIADARAGFCKTVNMIDPASGEGLADFHTDLITHTFAADTDVLKRLRGGTTIKSCHD